ncbi:aspartyl-phosphate phosphatase Spo0E family protein [Bacillus sp. FJAT-44742]|uniref:aspartyl-phosphate phosphatase Spo0E family protein n=1 Tax=Bacillus sp. FJAT-44742 TaxID=2014005 RepID=UPI0018E23136|nr:aspartyl-phosphate phosphatase Spo0E family protein [Bacillus sp. FJAT-44742]
MEGLIDRKIKNKKLEMYKKAELYGFTDKRTVHCSQELDILLNKQLGLQKKTGDLSLV